MIKIWHRLRRWLRQYGLAPFGFAQEYFGHHAQLLYVWEPLHPARWEVWRWPPETGDSDKDVALCGFALGSREMYRRIMFHADLVHVGSDFRKAMNHR